MNWTWCARDKRFIGDFLQSDLSQLQFEQIGDTYESNLLFHMDAWRLAEKYDSNSRWSDAEEKHGALFCSGSWRIRRSASVGNAIATWNGEVRTLRRTCGNVGPQARSTVCGYESVVHKENFLYDVVCLGTFFVSRQCYTLRLCVRIQLQENCGSSCISIAFGIAHIYLQIIRRIRRWGANNIIRPFDRSVSIPVFPF